MDNRSDWRLLNQEKYLKGVTLFHRKYRRSLNPRWDHDHCEFCWATFMVEDHTNIFHQGYATADDYRWICEKCFDDFKTMFGWSVVECLNKG